MYCSSCGAAITEGLSYCNRCGAEASAKRSTVPLKPVAIPESLVWALVAVSVGGLALVIGLMAVMKAELKFNDGLIILFSLLSFLLLLAAESVFIWLLVRSKNSAREALKITQPREVATKGLGAAHGRALPGPQPSVTEHTTRTLEPAYREHKTE